MLLLKPVEILLNKALAVDVESRQKLAAFTGRQLQIELTDFKRSLIITFQSTHLQLSQAEDSTTAADLTIAGSSTALLAVARHPDNLFSADIRILGDVQFAKQLQDWLAGFDFDWEAQLARLTGDTLAYPIARQLRGTLNWLKHTSGNFQYSVSEYLREEVRLLPDTTEINAFMSTVDRVRSDVERLDARIARLGQRFAGKSS